MKIAIIVPTRERINRSITLLFSIISTVKDIKNEQPKTGSQTIGNVLTTNLIDGGKFQEGEIEYNEVVKTLKTNSKNYIEGVYNKSKSIVDMTNFNILSLTLDSPKYVNGKILDATEVKIIGKPDNVEKNINDLVSKVIDDIENNTNIVMTYLINSTNKDKRNVKSKLIELVKQEGDSLYNKIVGEINDLVTIEEELVSTFRRLDAVGEGIDGMFNTNGVIKVYDISGDNLQNIKTNYTTIGSNINSYYESLRGLVVTSYDSSKGISTSIEPVTPMTEQQYRFYSIMSSIFLNGDKYNSFVNTITGLISNNTDKTNVVKSCDEFLNNCDNQILKEKNLFDSYKLDKLPKFLEETVSEFDTKLTYTTKIESGENDKQKTMENVYSNINTNKDTDTYNGKIKFL